MLVSSLVIFLAVMHGSNAVGVRGEIVELSGSLVRILWHDCLLPLQDNDRICARQTWDQVFTTNFWRR